MNSILEGILGKRAVQEFTGTGAGAIPAVDSPAGGMVAPVPATKPSSKSHRLRDRVKARRSNTVNRIIGEDTTIPDDAEEVRLQADVPQFPGMKTGVEDADDDISEPDISSAEKEYPMKPTVALVAPDATPAAFQPIDVSKVPPPAQTTRVVPPAPAPGEPSAMDVLLGKAAATSAAPSSVLPSGIPTPSEIAQGGAVAAESMVDQNQPMPEHKPGNGGKSILEAMRRAGVRMPKGESRI